MEDLRLGDRLVKVGAAKKVAAGATDELAAAVFEAAAAGGAVDAVVLGGVEWAGGEGLRGFCGCGLGNV